MTQLVRQFVCPRCGGTAPLSDRPFQECASCNAVGDYDYGVARVHPEWPKHEAMFARLWGGGGGDLGEAMAARDLEAYAKAYAKLIGQLIHQCPGLQPKRATEPAYREQLAKFQGYWQAITCLEPSLAVLDNTFRALRTQVKAKGGHAKPETLWPLIDHCLKQFDEIQRISDVFCGPPDDFVPGYVKRFMVSITIAEWLPQLKLEDQRTLVERFDVSSQYLAPEKDKVICRNCGGTVEVEPEFLKMPCPFCTAEIQEARADFRAIEKERVEGAGFDAAYGTCEAMMKATTERLQLLEGDVYRKDKLYRFVVLRAVFGDRTMSFLRMYDKHNSKKLAAMIHWAEQFTERRKMPLDRIKYREHPKCLDLPEKVDELVQRLANTAPGARPYVSRDGDGHGSSVEVVLPDQTVVRLLFDEEGKRTKMIQTWLKTFPTS